MSSAYQITSLVTLETSTVSLDKLSRSLKLNSIVSYDGQPIGLVTHWDLVFFSRTWAGWALEERGEKPPPSDLEALSLVDQWLQDPGSVSREELWAAVWAAAWAAAAAARAAAGAAEAAGAAARAAARAADTAEAAAYQRQGEFITEHLKNSSQTSFPFPRA